ncbi:MAG: FKBP-type peptidyl-prolyl cis-trans isomerase [Oscillospiraceae bacterium]|nr:FKBP-type peptidyl-prolyl cis-trans isomerase [Oscillospiraceae bacterium]
MLKRILSLALALVLALSLFACSGNTETPADNTEQEVVDYSEFTLSTGLDENGYFKGVKAADCVELAPYKGITLSNDLKVANEDQVNYQLENVVLAPYQTFQKITDRAVQKGDLVNIDYVGSIAGVEFDGGSTQGQGTDVTAGAANYIDDFLDQIIGHMPGETFDVNVTFPADYGNESLNGKDAKFVTTINFIKDMDAMPALTDAIAMEYGFYTAEELVADVRNWVLAQAKDDMIDAIVADSNVKTMPDTVVNYCKNYLITVYEINTGVSLTGRREEFLQLMQSTLDNLCKYYLVIQAIAEREGLKADDASVSGEDMASALASYGKPYAKRFVLSEQLVPQFIIDNAVFEN